MLVQVSNVDGTGLGESKRCLLVLICAAFPHSSSLQRIAVRFLLCSASAKEMLQELSVVRKRGCGFALRLMIQEHLIR
jgi:hypothetical protein